MALTGALETSLPTGGPVSIQVGDLVAMQNPDPHADHLGLVLWTEDDANLRDGWAVISWDNGTVGWEAHRWLRVLVRPEAADV